MKKGLLSVSLCLLSFTLVLANSVDTTFGNGGRVISQIGDSISTCLSVAMTPSGKVVCAGSAFLDSESSFALVQYNTDGSIDSSFGINGIVLSNFEGGHYSAWRSVKIQNDGKIVAAGGTLGCNGFPYGCFVLARYNADGSSDSTFNHDGRVQLAFDASNFGNALAIQPDGKLIIAGRTIIGPTYHFASARYLSNGDIDTSYKSFNVTSDTSGIYTSHCQSLALQSDGKIVAGGSGSINGNASFAMVRYNVDGNLDIGFGISGKVGTDFGYSEDVRDVEVQADNKILVAGYATMVSTGEDFAMVRYNTDGSLDSSFNFDGKVTTDLDGQADKAYAILLNNGKIILCGSSGYHFALVQYNYDGSIDSSFGIDGKIVTSLTGYCNSGTLQDGKIVLGGYTRGFGGAFYTDFALARFNIDLEVSFNPIQQNAVIILSPNPATTSLNIQLPQTPSSSTAFQLFDITGRMILEKPLTETSSQIDLNGVSKGMYLYNVVSEKEKAAGGKLIIE